MKPVKKHGGQRTPEAIATSQARMRALDLQTVPRVGADGTPVAPVELRGGEPEAIQPVEWPGRIREQKEINADRRGLVQVVGLFSEAREGARLDVPRERGEDPEFWEALAYIVTALPVRAEEYIQIFIDARNGAERIRNGDPIMVGTTDYGRVERAISAAEVLIPQVVASRFNTEYFDREDVIWEQVQEARVIREAQLDEEQVLEDADHFFERFQEIIQGDLDWDQVIDRGHLANEYFLRAIHSRFAEDPEVRQFFEQQIRRVQQNESDPQAAIGAGVRALGNLIKGLREQTQRMAVVRPEEVGWESPPRERASGPTTTIALDELAEPDESVQLSPDLAKEVTAELYPGGGNRLYQQYDRKLAKDGFPEHCRSV